MTALRQRIQQLLRDEEGATMVEYALMVALIAVVCIVAVSLLGDNASERFDDAATAIAG